MHKERGAIHTSSMQSNIRKDVEYNFLHQLSCRSALLSRQKKAFTLAEVLITLTIIGVVAAVTVPTLTKKTGNQEYVSKLLKVYSVLSQATDEIILEKGKPLGASGWANDGNTIIESYKNHLRGSKACTTENECKHISRRFKYLGEDGNVHTSYLSWAGNGSGLIMADGAHVIYFNNPGNAKVSIVVDINGNKAPNELGRDAFWFYITNDGLVPRGANTDECPGTDPLNKGKGCAYRVIVEGEMNY